MLVAFYVPLSPKEEDLRRRARLDVTLCHQVSYLRAVRSVWLSGYVHCKGPVVHLKIAFPAFHWLPCALFSNGTLTPTRI